MKIKTALIAACAALSLACTTQAAVTVNYDNDTGAYSISGGDSGTGTDSGNASFGQVYIWSWDTSVIAFEFSTIIQNLVPESITGQLGGNAASLLTQLQQGVSNRGFGFGPINDGPLSIDTKSGTIATGLWTGSGGTFIGTPHNGPAENVTLNVTAVPETSTYAALAGLAALGLAVWHRRRAV